MAKAQRTSRELQEAIMHEVRRHPEWNDILSVTKGHRGEPKIRRSWRFPRGLLRSKHFGRRLARTGALLSRKRWLLSVDRGCSYLLDAQSAQKSPSAVVL